GREGQGCRGPAGGEDAGGDGDVRGVPARGDRGPHQDSGRQGDGERVVEDGLRGGGGEGRRQAGQGEGTGGEGADGGGVQQADRKGDLTVGALSLTELYRLVRLGLLQGDGLAAGMASW